MSFSFYLLIVFEANDDLLLTSNFESLPVVFSFRNNACYHLSQQIVTKSSPNGLSKSRLLQSPNTSNQLLI